MSARTHRRARAAAYKEANRRGLWKYGEASLFDKWWRKVLAFIFPKTRKRYMDAIGRWYKATLKTWSHAIAESFNDPDKAEFMRARKRIAKRYKGAL